MSGHREIAERKIGRHLKGHEVVHHINGNHGDNRPGNLMVMSTEEHGRLHGSRHGALRIILPRMLQVLRESERSDEGHDDTAVQAAEDELRELWTVLGWAIRRFARVRVAP